VGRQKGCRSRNLERSLHFHSQSFDERRRAGHAAGIATIDSVSVVPAANGVAKAAALIPALGSARFGTAIIDFGSSLPS
jgi:hypothetical protein